MSMKDFFIINKIGNLFVLMLLTGDGAYSTVYKVKRTSDN